MPVRWICKRCGYLLHEWSAEYMQSIPSTTQILLKIERCPKCGRTLSPPGPEDVEVKAVE